MTRSSAPFQASHSAASPDAGDRAESTPTSLRALAVRGSVWSVVGYGVSQVLRLAGNLVLTRLLFEEAFGLMLVVNVFMQGLTMFSDIGLGPSIIQNKRGDDRAFLNTAWTIQVLRGFALWVCACLLAWPVSAIYAEPMLGRLIPVAGLVALIAGFNSTALFTLNRRLALGRLTLLDIGSQAVSLVVMVSWALWDRSVWALVAGGLAGGFVKMVLTHFLLAGSYNRFHWDRSAGVALFRFGKWIFLSTLTTFLATQSDKLIFAKMIPFALLGVYSVAVMLAQTPAQVVFKIAGQVVFPSYSRILRDRGELHGAFSRVRLPLLLLGGAFTTLLVAAGPSCIHVLYDQRYHQAGWMLQWLAVVSWFRILECTNGSAMLAMGKPYWVAAGNGAKLVGMVALIPIGFWLYGFGGAIVGLVCAETFKYALSAWGASVNGLGAVRTDLPLTLAVGLSAGLGMLLSRAVVARGGGHLGALVAVGLVIGGGWAVCLLKSASIRRIYA